MELLNNAKSQITGWLGSGIPIPGLRKNEAAPADAAEAAPAEPAEPTEPKPEPKDDDDNSRYTRYEGLADAMSLQFSFTISACAHNMLEKP